MRQRNANRAGTPPTHAQRALPAFSSLRSYTRAAKVRKHLECECRVVYADCTLAPQTAAQIREVGRRNDVASRHRPNADECRRRTLNKEWSAPEPRAAYAMGVGAEALRQIAERSRLGSQSKTRPRSESRVRQVNREQDRAYVHVGGAAADASLCLCYGAPHDRLNARPTGDLAGSCRRRRMRNICRRVGDASPPDPTAERAVRRACCEPSLDGRR
ncbi:hypothetical protein EVAR_90304_1 [Eumeta japonica]|uniref:Uncharacterized protein n=1 Tax=Eumeta variegata TaxID=151549 RepID=A0A4C1ZR73_EUMVA|nr:hypothetical protein EVAR_90304_1 [Eumeta japonica]